MNTTSIRPTKVPEEQLADFLLDPSAALWIEQDDGASSDHPKFQAQRPHIERLLGSPGGLIYFHCQP